jgi:uncharacterized membrane protein
MAMFVPWWTSVDLVDRDSSMEMVSLLDAVVVAQKTVYSYQDFLHYHFCPFDLNTVDLYFLVS